METQIITTTTKGNYSVFGWFEADTPVIPLGSNVSWKTLSTLNQPLYIVYKDDEAYLASVDEHDKIHMKANGSSMPIVGFLPATPMESLGDPAFCEHHNVRYAYVTGSMANGIASVDLVEAVAKHGFLGFFGAAGLSRERIEAAILELKKRCPGLPYGINLIHSPNEPEHEKQTVDLFLAHDIHLIEASAFMDLSLALVRYRLNGIYRDDQGHVVTPNRIVAKVSREEVAAKFLSPPPDQFIQQLVAANEITAEQGLLAREIPMAQDVIAEADSGGHTDNRPALSLLPTIISVRDQMQAKYEFRDTPRVGLGGGISTPASAVAAFAMGAAFIVTGTVNQSCREAGTSDDVRGMLAQARQADIAMAPAADMFEMGVDVQVLKRGTMFSMRGAKLYEIYRRYQSIDEIPSDEREKIEKTMLRSSFDDAWRSTCDFWQLRDPQEIERANKDPKHKMALIFRAYLGQASRWANSGESTRKLDYQIWCGPAMGAFNEWTRGSFLEAPENRKVVTVAMNILFGTALLVRQNLLRNQGIKIPAEMTNIRPLTLQEMGEYLN